MGYPKNIIIYFIRLFAMNLLVYFCFTRICNIKNHKNIILIVISNLVITAISAYINFYLDFFLSVIFLTITYSMILGVITKVKLGYALVTGIISYAICLVIFILGLFLSFIPYKFIYNIFGIENEYLNLLILLTIQFIEMNIVRKIKRFKNGFNFLRDKLNNDFTDIIVINICTILILIYCLIGSCIGAYHKEIMRNLFTSFVILAITMIITIQRTFTMYYKQKLMKDTLADYKRELKEKDDEIERINNEKFNISKITHEFYNRQKSLELAVKRIIEKANLNTEMAEELSALDKIKDLTDEYSEKLKEMKSLPALPLTEISEIDDMFKYMQAECDKDGIEFKLKVSGNMFYLVNNIIPKNKLATLIGDHVRDAIIAINFNESENKEIFVILGVKDKKYELCVYDTGIEFEINTLLKLGLEPATTHKDTGGSGMGFLTTFETLNETKASLIIREELPKENMNYTKAVIIRFDNKHQYKICSYRANEIKKAKENDKKYKNRKIIIEGIE